MWLLWLNTLISIVGVILGILLASGSVISIANMQVSWAWLLLVDWFISPYRIAFDSVTPIEAARLVVEDAAGGVVESKKDGTLLVRSRMAVSVPSLNQATPDHVLSDFDDNISVSESSGDIAVFNKFRLTDGDLPFDDKIEWVPDEIRKDIGILKLYMNPWRNYVRLVHTGVGTVGLTLIGEVLEEKEELVVWFISPRSFYWRHTIKSYPIRTYKPIHQIPLYIKPS